ncbi:MAG: DUF1570 domain-containing protein [Thermoguttaceae bacterium]|jgi:hypothetical protein
MTPINLNRTLFSAAIFLGWTVAAWGMDQVVLRHEGREITLSGRLLITAEDGGLLLLARDGLIWPILPEDLIKHTSDAEPFAPFTREEMAKRLLAVLPKNFEVLPVNQYKHYLIFYDTSRTYAHWCGSLFERLYMAFTNFWSQKPRDFELTKPEFPLVAVIFADKQAYLKFTRADLGDAGESIVGYFNLATNRMTMYDLTGAASAGRPSVSVSTGAQINQILARPEALQTVSTIVHEATHQIAFNCGLHTRLSDCPVWFSEGIAVFFETPDLNGAKGGWNGIGAVNRVHLEQFQKYLSRRPADSLSTLITTDKRLHDLKQTSDAYAEAWALTNFLIKQHPKEYIAYLRMLSKKKPLLSDSPQTRLDEFQRAFGDIKKLDTEFLRYMGRVR